MKVRVLGAFGGKIPGQDLTGFLVDEELAIDAGSIAQGLELDAQLKLKHLLISHTHLDHLYTLFYLLENRFYNDANNLLRIYASQEAVDILTKEFLIEDIMNLPAISNFKKLVKIETVEPGKQYQIGNYVVEPVKVNHYAGALGYFISDGKAEFLFTSDTGPNRELWERLKMRKNCQLLITEVSFPNQLEEVARLSRHLTPELLQAELSQADLGRKEIYLYHLKPGHLDQIFRELSEVEGYELHLLKSGIVLEVGEPDEKEKALLKEKIESVSGKVPRFDFSKDLNLQRQALDHEFGLSFEPGEIICAEGEAGKHLYIIQEGQVEVFRVVLGKKKVLAILGPGDIFGEMSIFFSQPRTATVKAITRVRVYAFDRPAFEQLIQGNYGIAIKLIRMLAQRLQEADVQIENLLYRDNDSKVINTLVRAIEDEGIKTKTGYSLRLTPEQLGIKTDLPAEEIKKTLARLIKNGVVSFKDGIFEIPDLERLRRLLEYLEMKSEFEPMDKLKF